MKAALAIVIGVVVAVIVYFATRGHDEHDKPAAPPSVQTAKPAETVPPVVDAAPLARIRRLVDTAARERVMAAILTARARRQGTAPPMPQALANKPSLDDLPLMSKEDVKSSFKQVIPLLVECYEQALPHLKVKDGSIEVHMRATGEPDVGTLIDEATLDSTTAFLDDPDLRECLHETLMSVELPPMPEGGVVEITYPIVFKESGE